MKKPKRIVPRFYAESLLIFCVSSVLDPIGDRGDVYIGHPLIGGPPYQAGAAPHTRPGRPPIPGRGGPPYQAALSNMSGFCLICRGFVLSVGALYSLLGLCLVISCSGGPRPLGGRPQAPRRAAPGPSAGGPGPIWSLLFCWYILSVGLYLCLL